MDALAAFRGSATAESSQGVFFATCAAGPFRDGVPRAVSFAPPDSSAQVWFSLGRLSVCELLAAEWYYAQVARPREEPGAVGERDVARGEWAKAGGQPGDRSELRLGQKLASSCPGRSPSPSTDPAWLSPASHHHQPHLHFLRCTRFG